jgi:NAD(P)-dependent dehydrogenase (short-subunit alcohol dehydrogenase family)/acyl carrier protein
MTGYSIDMLDERLDLEADLGIDTVKQVEIFGKVCEKFGMSVPEDIKLTEFNTIEKLGGFISGNTSGAGHALPVQAQGAAAVTAQAPLTQGAASGAVIGDIKAIISEMTGYGIDMLDERLDLEADLGIDTVKQVEIFGKVCEKFGMSVPEDIKLTEFNTIEKLGGFINNANSGTSQPAPAAAAQASALSETEKESAISRFVVRTEAAKMPAGEAFSFEGKTILVTDDGKGFAKKIGSLIEARKGKAVYLGKGGDVDVRMNDLDALDAATKTLATKGGIDGIIYCAHLAPYFDGQKIDTNAINAAVKGYFVTVKNLYNVINKKGSLIAAPVFNSMVFAYADPKSEIYPLFGSVTGFMKSVRKELKDTLVKAVDYSVADAASKIDEIAETFVREIISGDTRIEIGYRNGERFRVILEEKSPEKETPFVKDGDTVLVTGGARGITFEILKGLVSKYKVNLVICARSSIALEAEFAKPGIGEQEIFNALAQKMAGAKPVEIKKAVAKVKGQLEAAANIKTLESLGAKVDYHAVDVTDGKSLGAVIAALPKIDGIIHAAGFEESQLIPRKDLKTFNSVFDTKITGALNLINALKGKEYRFFIGFSSVAARFGNDGQCDYSAANEMLCRLLQKEKRTNPGRAYKVFDWTAWGEVGMATKEAVIKFLSAQGVEFLPVKLGVEFFLNDLTDPKEDEVVVTNKVPAFDRDGLFSSRKPEHGSAKAPFLGKTISKSEEGASWCREFVLSNDTFFDHHTKDGVPLFLGATGLEMMAEASSALNEGKWLYEVKDFSIPYGIKLLQGKSKEIHVNAKRNADGSVDSELTSVFMKDGKVIGQPTLHYRGRYSFSDKKPKAVKVELPALRKVKWDGELAKLLYHPKRLFMTELFQTVEDVIGMNDKTIVVKIHTTSKVPFFAHIDDPEFVIDPVIVDGLFQSGGLFEFLGSGDTILPYRIAKMTRYKEIDRYTEYTCAATLIGRDDTEKTRAFDIDLIDKNGNLCLRVENFQMIAVGKPSAEDSIVGKFKVE